MVARGGWTYRSANIIHFCSKFKYSETSFSLDSKTDVKQNMPVNLYELIIIFNLIFVVVIVMLDGVERFFFFDNQTHSRSLIMATVLW